MPKARALATMHSNRVFAIKCHPTDPNLVYSSGWDSTVQFWDLRSEKPVRACCKIINLF